MIITGIIASIILIGFFAGLDVAFVSINRLSVELKKKQGRHSGVLFSFLMDQPSRFIGTTLVGFNVFLVIYGVLVGAILQPGWDWIIKNFHISVGAVNVVRLVFETFASSFIVILFGEFLPKAFWRAKNEFMLTGFVASLTNFFYKLFYPVASFFVSISSGVLKYLFNVRINAKKEAFSRADLEHFFQNSSEMNEEHQDLNTGLFENALSLPNVKVRQCLVPRKEIIGVDINTTVKEVRKKMVETKLSKLVVFENNIDQIIGYIHQLDLFKQTDNIRSIMLPIPAVPESMGATDLISKFSRDHKSMAWVVDEFGGTAGIVTMEDLLEEIFGEIKDEHDTEEVDDKKISDEEYVFSGRLELDYLNEKYGLDFPIEESETLSGFIINQHETIPKVKERIIIGDYEFDVMNVSDTRIEMVKMKILK
ncbi:MAG: HlyC/CorC family transporter [Chitinophagaceae bacterium]|nr:HlyC/CorC family transporter [Chitinophagaceae bacterium]